MNFIARGFRFLRDGRGVAGVEYALLAAGIAMTVLVAVFAAGDSLGVQYDSLLQALSGH